MDKSKIDQISELFELFNSGTITKEEFEQLKTRIIQEGHLKDTANKSFADNQMNVSDITKGEDFENEAIELESSESSPLKSFDKDIEEKKISHSQNETKTQERQNDDKYHNKNQSVKRKLLLFFGLVILGLIIFKMVHNDGGNFLVKDKKENDQPNLIKQQTKVSNDITDDRYLKTGSLDEIINHPVTEYTILEYKKGDLNRDEFTDLIVIYKQKDEDKAKMHSPDDPVYRPTLLYTGTVEGKVILRAINIKVVYCYDCGGVFGDPFENVVIKNGFFTFEHMGGAGYRWTRFVTFRYSEQLDNWTLHRDGGVLHHRGDPENVTNIMHTIDDFGRILFEEFDIYDSDYYFE